MFVTDVKCSQATRQIIPNRGQAAPQLLSPKLLCVRGTAHMLSKEDRRDRRLPSEMRRISLTADGSLHRVGSATDNQPRVTAVGP